MAWLFRLPSITVFAAVAWVFTQEVPGESFARGGVLAGFALGLIVYVAVVMRLRDFASTRNRRIALHMAATVGAAVTTLTTVLVEMVFAPPIIGPPPSWWLHYGPAHGDHMAFSACWLAALVALLCRCASVVSHDKGLSGVAILAPRLFDSMPDLVEFFAVAAVGLIPAAFGGPSGSAIICGGLVPAVLVYRKAKAVGRSDQGSEAEQRPAADWRKSDFMILRRMGAVILASCLFIPGSVVWAIYLLPDHGNYRVTPLTAVGSVACVFGSWIAWRWGYPADDDTEGEGLPSGSPPSRARHAQVRKTERPKARRGASTRLLSDHSGVAVKRRNPSTRKRRRAAD